MKPRRLTLTLALVAVAALVVSAGASANGSKLILSDPFTTQGGCQHKTVVEPDTFSGGSTIVAVAELGLCTDGGATGIGFATSTNNGVSWTSGALPGITRYTSPPGPYDEAAAPSVAFDARHNVWIAVSVGLQTTTSQTGAAVLASRSTNGGATWTNPVIIASAGAGQNFEKPWIVCDNGSASLSFGTCYVQFDDRGHSSRLMLFASTNGGLTWIARSVPSISAYGGQPLVQPSGKLIIPIDNPTETTLSALVSTNIGWTFVTITSITAAPEPGNFRSGPLPSAEIDGAGRVFVTWEDCRFRVGCPNAGTPNDLVYVTSSDGINWSAVQRIPIDPVSSAVDHFLPGIGVDKATSGSGAHVSVTYYYFPNVNCTLSTCQLDAGSISSANGAATWSAPVQFAGPMPLNLLPSIGQSPTVGDYISTSFAGNGTSHGAVIVAKPPPLTEPFNVALYDPPVRFR
jgi:hypothetical protein